MRLWSQRALNPKERYAILLAGLAYVAIVAAAVAHHEPWSDEAQSWLLARDSHPLELWTRLLHYEGTPGLWPGVLQLLIRFGLPYKALNAVSSTAGFAAVYLVLIRAPFPPALRVLLPFSYFLCYQYAVIARSYCLLPVLMLSCAILFNHALERTGLFTGLLCLLAAVSAQGFIVSAAIWLAFQLRVGAGWSRILRPERKKLIGWATVYVVILLLLGASAWPTPDVSFSHVTHVTAKDAYTSISEQLGESFGSSVIAVLAIGLTIPFLWRKAGLPVFLLSIAALLAFGTLVYANVWHSGVLFLVWLTAIWISAENTKPSWIVLASLLGVSAIQCYWTAVSAYYDWNHPYSGSAAAATYIENSGVLKQPIYGIGFATVGVQAYFPHNIFDNFGALDAPAFWLWSKRNRINDAVEKLGSLRPPHVLISYMSPPEQLLWSRLVLASGYKWVKHFEGDIFWRTTVLQPDGYDLYERGPITTNCSLASTISLAEKPKSAQLLWGFYDEAQPWSWTARKFSVVLQRPPAARQAGVRLKLHFYLPDSQIAKLGRMTLSASAGGRRLRPRRFSKGGVYEYVEDVPATALYDDMVSVDFSFDKASPSSARDARELAAVVMDVGLVSP